MVLDEDADSLQSVTAVEEHPYIMRRFVGGQLRPFLEDPQKHQRKRRQELEPLYVLNGAIYIVKRDLLMNEDTLVGERNCGYVMPKERSIDIDDAEDFELAEFFLSRQSGNLGLEGD
jgi:CMP-N,N'-diacetyllegionaminic acid synthase